MGEVYRARDTKLERDVALKVLPAELAANPERLARFEREAKAIAALDHPNIVTIYSVEEVDEVHFITTQIVEGPTLSGLIPGQGLVLEQFFELAIPLADAVSAAHENGIVHRDLKPANVMVSGDGRVRVLDFGLAKLREETSGTASPEGAGTADTEMATVQATSGGTDSPLTEEGKILGTVAYMSPEQAEGKPVDHRADIFSLGVILYEMATGERPFKGDTNLSILTSVMRDTPTSITELNRTLPRHLGRIVKHSLEKDPERRFQSAKDLRNHLSELRKEIESGEMEEGAAAGPAAGPSTGGTAVRAVTGTGSRRAPHPAQPGWHRWLPWAVAAVLTVVIAFTVWDRMQSPPAEFLVTRSSLVLPSSHRLETDGPPPLVAISPDGTRIAYAMGAALDASMIYLWDIAESEPRALSGTEGGYGPFFSPDGTSLGFFSFPEEKLMRISLEGGVAAVPLTEARDNRGGDWGPDDTIVYSPSSRSGLWRVSAVGGDAERLTEPDEGAGERWHRWPNVLPNGKGVIFSVGLGGRYDDCSIEVLTFESGERRAIASGAMARYSPSGHLLVARSGQLLAAPFDIDRLELTGSLVPVETEVFVTSGGPGSAHFGVSGSGTLVYLPAAAGRRLVLVDLDGSVQQLPEIPPLPHSYIVPRFSPDGERLAVGTGGGIFTYEFRRAAWSQVPIQMEGLSEEPLTPFGGVIWSPDGEWLAFNAWGRRERPNIFRVRVDGSGTTERLASGDGYRFPATSTSFRTGLSSSSAWCRRRGDDGCAASLHQQSD